MADYKGFDLLKGDDATLEEGDGISLFYIPLKQAILWDDNSKKHSIPKLIESIKDYGFKDPPSWDATLQGIIEGNGRVTALREMQLAGEKPPRGVRVQKETGEWCVPILFGLDADSKNTAVRYAIDHNNLTMMGGDFTMFEISRMWEQDKYLEVLGTLEDEYPLTVSPSDFQVLSDAVLGFEQLEDLSDKEDVDMGAPMPVLKIKVGNFNIIDDITDALRSFLNEHPEWDCRLEA